MSSATTIPAVRYGEKARDRNLEQGFKQCLR
jgi:hypothetical protein